MNRHIDAQAAATDTNAASGPGAASGTDAVSEAGRSSRWKRRPDGSNWGEFGPDDQLGRPNLLGPTQVLKGAAEIRDGRSFCLSLPLDYPGGQVLNARRKPPSLRPTCAGGMPYLNFPLSRNLPDAIDVISDDQVLLSLQYSTQWDALAHVGAQFDADGDGVAERVYYNGYRANADIRGPMDYPDDEPGAAHACGGSHSYAHALSIDHLAVKGMQGRGVLVDLAHHVGDARVRIGYDALQRMMEADRVEVEPGDMLVLHTGFSQALLDMKREPDPHRVHDMCAVLDGRDERLLRWIADSGVVAIAADNYAVEGYPSTPVQGRAPALPLHHLCLFKLGIPLGELWYLTELAQWLRAQGRSRFFLTAPPLRLPGAVGSPVTPIATT